MPTSYSIDHRRRLVISRGWGVLSDADLRDHYHRLLNDPEFDPSYDQLVDSRDVRAVSATHDTIQDVAQRVSFAAGVRRVVLVADDLSFGLARMYASYAEVLEQGIHVVRDEDEAMQWLGLEDDAGSTAGHD